jgi:hypothetical protein
MPQQDASAGQGRGTCAIRRMIVARRKTGVPDKPAVGLMGWKFAAPQPVILKERPPVPRMKDLDRRSHPWHPSLSIPLHPMSSQFGVDFRGSLCIPISDFLRASAPPRCAFAFSDRRSHPWHPLPIYPSSSQVIPVWRGLQGIPLCSDFGFLRVSAVRFGFFWLRANG